MISLACSIHQKVMLIAPRAQMHQTLKPSSYRSIKQTVTPKSFACHYKKSLLVEFNTSIPISGQVDSVSATEAVHSGSIPSQVKLDYKNWYSHLSCLTFSK